MDRSAFNLALNHLYHHRTFPDGFDEWDASDAYGASIAHHAIRMGLGLPKGFSQWSLRDLKGRTVAHEAACHRLPLPENFSGWDWEDHAGISVGWEAGAQCYTREGFNAWHLSGKDGCTLAHEAALTGFPLPEDFDCWHWTFKSYGGKLFSVADLAVTHGLPHRGERFSYFDSVMHKTASLFPKKTDFDVIMASGNMQLIHEAIAWKENTLLRDGIQPALDDAPKLQKRVVI